MKKRILGFLVLAVLTGLPLAGCSGSGSGVTEQYEYTGFTRLDVSSAFDVTVTQSDTYSVTVTADESIDEYVSVTLAGDTLIMTLTPRHLYTDFTTGDRTLKAEITMPTLLKLKLDGASTATVEGFNSINTFALASSVSKLDVRAGMTDFNISGASSVSGNMSATSLNFLVSGASTVDLSGAAEDITLAVDGASKAEMEEFRLKVATVNLTGASSATIHVSERLNARLSGASTLLFRGNATLGITEVPGASTIKQQ
jgi:hypothetical protein